MYTHELVIAIGCGGFILGWCSAFLLAMVIDDHVRGGK